MEPGKYLIVPIVEGHGEVRAVPKLLKRWFKFRRFRNFCTLDDAIKASGSGALKCAHDPVRKLGLEYYVGLAMARRPHGLFVILDADEECFKRAGFPPHKRLGPELLARARAVTHLPVTVVVANREFEAWFLACYRLLQRRVSWLDQEFRMKDTSVEIIGGCKQRMDELMGMTYDPVVHQNLFVEHLSFGKGTITQAPSFGILLRKLDELAKAIRKGAS